MVAGLHFDEGVFRLLSPTSAVLILLIVTNTINVSLTDARTENEGEEISAVDPRQHSSSQGQAVVPKQGLSSWPGDELRGTGPMSSCGPGDTQTDVKEHLKHSALKRKREGR